MDSELKTKLNNYFNNLKSDLKELEIERKALIKKVNDGEALTRIENNRNKELATLISEIKEKLNKEKKLQNIRSIQENYRIIFSDSKTKEEKDKAYKSLLAAYKKNNKDVISELTSITDLDAKDIKNLEDLKNNIDKEISILETTINVTAKKGKNTNDLEDELEINKELLKTVKEYSKLYVNEVKLKSDLDDVLNGRLEEDDEIIHRFIPYNEQIKDLEDKIVEEIKMDMEEEILTEDEETLETKDSKESSNTTTRKRTEEKKNETDEGLKKAIKATLGVIGTAAVVAAIVVLVKNSKLDKNIEDNNDRTLQPEPTNSATEIVETKNPIIDKLVNKGYDEYTATLMTNNFKTETLAKVLNMPYVEAISYYASVNNFNIDYLNDYETYRPMFNITAAKVVDYVNRSYEIQATNFYDDAAIDDIIKVVMAIDNKDLFTNNPNLANGLNTTFSRIIDNYLFGTITDEDINKLDAMKYFAKKDSDLGNFLTECGILTQDFIKDKNNKEAQNKIINYITIFATSLNGYTNVPSAITSDETFNKNAQVNDYFDWFMAYNSFVGPLSDILMYPTELESVDLFYAEEAYYDTIFLENLSEEALENQKEHRKELLKYYGYNESLFDSIFRLYKIYDLRELMLTALNDPEIKNVCGQSRMLGGE